jgi:membrane protease YdiL (CAAX protease family)
MLVIALALIAWFSRGHFSEYGLEWPKHRNYVPSALLWGAAFGVSMTFVDYFPQIMRHSPPPENLALTPGGIGLRLFFEGIYVGPTEEIPFRGLLQTFLMQRTLGRIRFWKYDMHVAGVILALLFALAHPPASGQRTSGSRQASRYMHSLSASSMRTGEKNLEVCWLRSLDIT